MNNTNKKDKIQKKEEVKVDVKDNIQDYELIDLEELITVVKKYLRKPEKNTDLINLIGKLQIKAYLPLLLKTTTALGIIMRKNYSNTEYEEIKVAEMYKTIFFLVILGQYANIDVTNEKLFTYDNYDLLMPLLGEYILKFCKDDYQRFMDILKDSINFYNINEISSAVENIDYNKLEDAINSNKKLIQSLKEDRDLIEKLDNISKINSPQTAQVIQQVAKDIRISQEARKLEKNF